MTTEREYDVVVIGAGLGGLLAAAQFLRRGSHVAVVERLAHPGGRFTAKTFRGAQVSTGAVHMLPFGTNGELAGMLRALGVPHRVHDAEVFASFYVRGRQYVCRSILQLAGVLGGRQFAELGRLGAQMLLRAPTLEERGQSFTEWLAPRISRARSPELYAYFERMCHFALSVDLTEITYPEICEITKNMLRYGAPGVAEGGCAAVTGELERRVTEGGGELRLLHDVVAIEQSGGAVTGVRVLDRATGEESLLRAPMVISNIGPEATRRLSEPAVSSDDPRRTQRADRTTHPPLPHRAGESEGSIAAATPWKDEEAAGVHTARGLKVHLLSDASIVSHKGIMYCLDTQRIAGIVQPSNSDRRLAPPGKHLLITHQILRSEDVHAEREAARADLRFLFGEDFGTTVEILTMSQYRGEWPVNRVAQGEDGSPQTNMVGLYQVGDAVKPSGYLMVEGVAQSVNALLDTLDTLDAMGSKRTGATGKAHTPPKPPRARALHWLIAPPRPHVGS